MRPALEAWQSYYVIVGSSGGALIGLQFVVITLIADKPQRTSAGSLSAFGTPTVVHLTGALLVSAIMNVPWPGIVSLSTALGVLGLGGLLYSAVVIRRALRQTDYAPVLEDWIWYATLPSVTYGALAATSVLLHSHPRLALFVAAAAALGLLLIGIHNAWDTVTHLVLSSSQAHAPKRH